MLTLLAAGSALALAGPAAAASTPTTASDGPKALTTPILSLRRDPSWVDDTIAGQRLTRSLGALTGQLGAGKGAPSCVLVAAAGRQIYAFNPTTELVPASNLKILTATAVLDTLGPAARSTTTVEASSAPHAGTVTGNLYLVGGGDPYLMTTAYSLRIHYPDPTSTSLDRLASEVRAAGITTVTGSVIGDSTRYDSLVSVPTWPWQYLADQDVGPLSALEVNDGQRPPANPAASAPPAGPPPPGTPDPTLYAAQTFTGLLKAAGVQVAGPAATGRAPGGAVHVTQQQSAPSATAVEQMLRVSDDTAAELFTKELGYRVSGQGTTSAGTQVIRRDIGADGLPVDQMVAVDGSGLDRGDRATCALILAALERSGTSGPVAAGLPVAARTGTLEDRMTGTAAAGRLHGKTGTLQRVSALSGFVTPASGAPTPELGAPVYFSVIINGMDSDLAAPLVDRIGATIATYPRAVPLRDLEPRP